MRFKKAEQKDRFWDILPKFFLLKKYNFENKLGKKKRTEKIIFMIFNYL